MPHVLLHARQGLAGSRPLHLNAFASELPIDEFEALLLPGNAGKIAPNNLNISGRTLLAPSPLRPCDRAPSHPTPPAVWCSRQVMHPRYAIVVQKLHDGCCQVWPIINKLITNWSETVSQLQQRVAWSSSPFSVDRFEHRPRVLERSQIIPTFIFRIFGFHFSPHAPHPLTHQLLTTDVAQRSNSQQFNRASLRSPEGSIEAHIPHINFLCDFYTPIDLATCLPRAPEC